MSVVLRNVAFIWLPMKQFDLYTDVLLGQTVLCFTGSKFLVRHGEHIQLRSYEVTWFEGFRIRNNIYEYNTLVWKSYVDISK